VFSLPSSHRFVINSGKNPPRLLLLLLNLLLHDLFFLYDLLFLLPFLFLRLNRRPPKDGENDKEDDADKGETDEGEKGVSSRDIWKEFILNLKTFVSFKFAL
jgi:hypothetical protein